ncbi:hypothetical protein AB0K45_09480 [Micrococcus luteus]|uniref:hypothetical protein n=1 Tax=Micrococcus luteus TaxID=1270 RepID=UPI0034134D3C
MYVCLVIPSIIQMVRGPAPSSVQGRNDFDTVTVFAFGTIAILGSALVIYAAFCRDQYWSFVTELLGCSAVVLTYGIYLQGSRAVPDFLATNATWTAVGMILGHLIRGFIIGRRFW